MEIQVKEILKLKRRLNEILALHTGPADGGDRGDRDRDNFMSPRKR